MFASKDLFFSKPSGYQISRSVRLRSSASGYFNRTFTTPTSATIWTWSAWVKRGLLTGTYRLFGASTTTYLTFNSSDQLNLTLNGVSAATSTAVFRDPSAWYHIVYQQNGSAQTIYVNNVSVATGTTAASIFNTAISHQIAAANTTNFFDGYLTEINFIDGQALTPSSFGQTNTITGVWQPLKYTGTYGTNGFYLNFSDNSNNTATTIGKDYSGNGNNWTPNNISVTAGVTYDSMLDVPTPFADGGNGRGNYCVMNPLNPDTISLNGSLTNGNLNASGTTYGVSVFSCTFQVPQSGKWYWETVYTTITNTVLIGIRSYSTSSTDVRYYSNGNKEVGASTTAYGSSWTTNDVIGIAVDRDAGTVTFYKNNTSQGLISIPTNSAQFDITFNTTSPFGSTAMSVNFGQRPFSYTPPTGFVALNTQNLPTPAISNGANYFAATTYTGTGATQTISNAVNGVSFQPDLVWAKSRSAVESNRLIDSVRGATLVLYSNLTNVETTEATGLTAFGSSGFTLGSGSPNTSAVTYVGWQWNAGGSTVTNTSGSISAQVRANTTAGFSVVTYTGTGTAGTIGHGLGVPVVFRIVKARSAVGAWTSYHQSLGTGKVMVLSGTNAVQTLANYWDTTPTSTVMQTGNSSDVNANGTTYVNYCFSEVAGYSKFGSYTGNGSADGAFVFCGFRPRYVLLKRSDTADAWVVFDSVRGTYNLNSPHLQPHLSSAEADAPPYGLDLLSNGFKCRASTASMNASGGTYIFMAFAENPTKFSLAR